MKTDETLTMLAGLEDLLVQEFRASQAVLALTREERQALIRSDAAAVAKIAEEKEALLDELAGTGEQRRTVVQSLAGRLNLADPSPGIAGLSAALPAGAGDRLNRLREGILALSGEIQELTSGNRALAVAALERVDAVQTFILELCKPALNYSPPGSVVRGEPDVPWGIDVGM
jgi:flagellar biosynthesis/type III secretory pathway chaperone